MCDSQPMAPLSLQTLIGRSGIASSCSLLTGHLMQMQSAICFAVKFVQTGPILTSVQHAADVILRLHAA